MSDWVSLVHSPFVEAANLVAVVVFLEEETFACLAISISFRALSLAVGDGGFVVVGSSVYWVSSAVACVTAVGKGDLAVSWGVHEVDAVVAVV